MKKLALILCILLLLSLLGCDAKEVSPEADPRLEPVCGDGPEDPIVTEETPAPTEIECSGIPPEPPTESEVPDVPIESVIETKYYTLTLPDSWAGKWVMDLHERDNGSYSMSLHETQAFQEFGGGTLFALMMLTTGEDYTIFPSYELLGALDTPAGTFYVVALFPTDVQFTEETAEVYNRMYEDVTDVLYTLAPKDGVELAMP